MENIKKMKQTKYEKSSNKFNQKKLEIEKELWLERHLTLKKYNEMILPDTKTQEKTHWDKKPGNVLFDRMQCIGLRGLELSIDGFSQWRHQMVNSK